MGLIRLILALSVVIAHSGSLFGLNLVGGQIAVQAFYIISGFYMALILNEKYIGINSSYQLFISNRLLRLLPIYWIVLFLTISASLIVLMYTNGDNFGKLQDFKTYFDSMNLASIAFLIFTNIFVVFQDLVMFLGLDTTTGSLFFTPNFNTTNPKLYWFLLVPQAWTIGLEITFYFLAPFIVRRKVKYILLLIALSLLIRYFIYANGYTNDPWSYRFFPTELVFFLFGVIAYHIYKKVNSFKIKKYFLFGIFIMILVLTVFYSFVNMPYKMLGYFFLFFLGLPFVFILSKKWKVDRYIGELSYPVYISHILIYMIVTFLQIPDFGSESFLLIVATIIFSIALNEFVAKKVERYRQKRLIL